MSRNHMFQQQMQWQRNTWNRQEFISKSEENKWHIEQLQKMQSKVQKFIEHGKENTTSIHRNKTAQVIQINSTSQNSTGIGAQSFSLKQLNKTWIERGNTTRKLLKSSQGSSYGTSCNSLTHSRAIYITRWEIYSFTIHWGKIKGYLASAFHGCSSSSELSSIVTGKEGPQNNPSVSITVCQQNCLLAT